MPAHRYAGATGTIKPLVGLCLLAFLLASCDFARRLAPGGFLRPDGVQPSDPNPYIEERIEALEDEVPSDYPSLADMPEDLEPTPGAAERAAAERELTEARDALQ